MRIAIPYENGIIFQHFGHTARFAIYDAEGGAILSKVILPAMGSGHGALAGFLKTARVDTLICGGIGGGAQTALAQAGIRLFAGVQGDCDEAAKALAEGRLVYDPLARCDHHDHGDHSCGEHSCAAHTCGGSCH